MSKKQRRGAVPAEQPKPSASKRDPNPGEQAAMDKAVAYCRGRTAPLVYEIKKAEGSDITVEIPHNNAGGFIAQQRATFTKPLV